MQQKVSFSGHESFICKQFWLKKVFDFCRNRLSFSDDLAVVDLGVGKNMVASLRYWGKAFGIIDDNDRPTWLGDYLFGPDGRDPYLEDLGTIWLLHYQLVKTNRASIYHMVFNEFRKERIDFTRDHLHAFLKRKCEEVGPNFYTANTITTDVNVFFRNYVKPHKDEKVEVEDDFTGVLMDLGLVKHFKQRIDDKISTWYRIEGDIQIDLPAHIVLYAIIDNFQNSPSISFRDLQSAANSPGSVFALNADGLYDKLNMIHGIYPDIIFTETAGNQVLQIKSPITIQEVLDEYFEA